MSVISNEREDDLFRLWSEENEDPDSMEWREDLSADERALVCEWDLAYQVGVSRMAQRILDLEEEMRHVES